MGLSYLSWSVTALVWASPMDATTSMMPVSSAKVGHCGKIALCKHGHLSLDGVERVEDV